MVWLRETTCNSVVYFVISHLASLLNSNETRKHLQEFEDFSKTVLLFSTFAITLSHCFFALALIYHLVPRKWIKIFNCILFYNIRDCASCTHRACCAPFAFCTCCTCCENQLNNNVIEQGKSKIQNLTKKIKDLTSEIKDLKSVIADQSLNEILPKIQQLQNKIWQLQRNEIQDCIEKLESLKKESIDESELETVMKKLNKKLKNAIKDVIKEFKNKFPHAGNGNPQAGNGDPQAGNGDPLAGNGDPQAGNGNPQAGNGDPQAGNGNLCICSNFWNFMNQICLDGLQKLQDELQLLQGRKFDELQKLLQDGDQQHQDDSIKYERVFHFILAVIVSLILLAILVIVFFCGQYQHVHILPSHSIGQPDLNFRAFEASAEAFYVLSLFSTLVNCFFFSYLMYSVQNDCEDQEKILGKITTTQGDNNSTIQGDNIVNTIDYLATKDEYFVNDAVNKLGLFQLWFLIHWIFYIISSFLSLALLLEAIVLYVKAVLPHVEAGVRFAPIEMGLIFMFSIKLYIYFS